MGETKPKSWKRDLARAVLLAALLIGLPAIGMAGAHYRKHIQACYWAWKWTRGKQPSFDLCDKLHDHDIEPSYSAAKVAHRLAYSWAPDEKRKLRAAWRVAAHFGLRELYTLATVDGDDSPAGRILREWLAEITGSGFDTATAREEGFTNVSDDWYPPEDYTENVFRPRRPFLLDFGSYRIFGYASWKRPSHESPWYRELREDTCTVHRLPGPWRDLPPALKPEPVKFECHYRPL